MSVHLSVLVKLFIYSLIQATQIYKLHFQEPQKSHSTETKYIPVSQYDGETEVHW